MRQEAVGYDILYLTTLLHRIISSNHILMLSNNGWCMVIVWFGEITSALVPLTAFLMAEVMCWKC